MSEYEQMQASEWMARGLKPKHFSYHTCGLAFPDGQIDFVHWRMLTLRYYGLYR